MADLVPLLGPVAGAVTGGVFALVRWVLARRSARTENMEHQRAIREAVDRAADNGCLVVVVCGSCLGGPSTAPAGDARP